MAKGIWVGAVEVKNKLDNGNFETDAECNLSGITSKATISRVGEKRKYGSYALKAVVNTTSTDTQQLHIVRFDAVAGHKYYMSGWFEFSGSTSQPRVIFSSANSWDWLASAKGKAGASGWQRLSCVYTNDTYTALRARWSYGDNAYDASNPSVMYLDGCVLADLTEAFGSGKEPDKEWCDSHLDWFAGSKNFGNDVLSGAGYARKVKNLWVGVDGIARRVKKAWIGVGGKARLFFYRAIEKSNATTDNFWSYYPSSANVGDYVIFASERGSLQHAFNSELVAQQVTGCNSTRMASGSTPSYACFGGGVQSSSTDAWEYVSFISSGLTETTVRNKSLGTNATFGCSFKQYAVLYSFVYDDNMTLVTTLDYSNPVSRAIGVNYLANAAATAGDSYCIHAGITQDNNEVVAFDENFTAYTCANLSVGRSDVRGCTNGQHAIFTGGRYLNSNEREVITGATDAYDVNLTRTVTTGYSKRDKAYARLGDYAVFAGGCNGSWYYKCTCDNGDVSAQAECFDQSLVRTSLPSLSVARGHLGGGSIGDKALFIGGLYMKNASDNKESDYVGPADVYQL